MITRDEANRKIGDALIDCRQTLRAYYRQHEQAQELLTTALQLQAGLVQDSPDMLTQWREAGRDLADAAHAFDLLCRLREAKKAEWYTLRDARLLAGPMDVISCPAGLHPDDGWYIITHV